MLMCWAVLGGFVLDASQWRARRVLRVVKTVCYAEEKA